MSALTRLSEARKKAAGYAARHPDHHHYKDWRHWIIRKVKPKVTWRDPENVNILYVDSLEVLGWRKCGDSNEICTWIRHNGWYADNFQDTLIVGCVLQLPTRNGVEQYVPATYQSDSDTATVYLNEITPEKKDAARWADQSAEREAELSREFYAKDSAQQQIAEARDEIHVINRQVLPALKELKGARLTPAICSMVRAGIADLLGDRAEKFRTIKRLEDDFWRAVPQ